jgi:hypothetical protein
LTIGVVVRSKPTASRRSGGGAKLRQRRLSPCPAKKEPRLCRV